MLWFLTQTCRPKGFEPFPTLAEANQASKPRLTIVGVYLFPVVDSVAVANERRKYPAVTLAAALTGLST